MLTACILTVLLETAVFCIAGRRDRDSVLIIVCANVITNLGLGFILYFCPSAYYNAIYPLETLIVFSEYLIYAFFFGGSLNLFVLTLLANILSYLTGTVLMIKL